MIVSPIFLLSFRSYSEDKNEYKKVGDTSEGLEIEFFKENRVLIPISLVAWANMHCASLAYYKYLAGQ